METNSSSRSNKTLPYTPDPSAPPIAEAVVVDSNGIEKEAAALRERVAMQEQKIAEQSTIIQQQQAHYSNTFRGRYKQEEDMTLRMKFLRQHACKLAFSPLRIVASILLGWCAMWVFIWCYVWNLATNIMMWFALQSLHIFTCCNSPFVEYAQLMTMRYAGQHNCLWWKAKYKLEGSDNDNMYYTV